MDNAILQSHVHRKRLKSCYKRLEEIWCPIDPFQNIAPLLSSTSNVYESETICSTEVTEDFINLHLANDNNDSDWQYEDDDFNRNAFDFITDNNDH